jgi:hypothetical protein
MKARICLLVALLVARSVSATPCTEYASAIDVSLKLTHKAVRMSHGVTTQMGTFEISNNGAIPIVLGAYKDSAGFSLWHPDAWLERKGQDGTWQGLSDSYSDTVPAPNTFVVVGNSQQSFMARIHTEDASAGPTTELRLVIHTQKPGFCIASNAFTDT